MGVKLKPADLETLIDITQKITDYKHQALRSTSWEKFSNDYLPSLVEQLRDNDFRCHRRDDSTFTWIIDQICHSRRLTPGVSHRDGISLADTELGSRAIEICRHATQGQEHYNSWSTQNRFTDLFD